MSELKMGGQVGPTKWLRSVGRRSQSPHPKPQQGYAYCNLAHEFHALALPTISATYDPATCPECGGRVIVFSINPIDLEDYRDIDQRTAEVIAEQTKAHAKAIFGEDTERLQEQYEKLKQETLEATNEATPTSANTPTTTTTPE